MSENQLRKLENNLISHIRIIYENSLFNRSMKMHQIVKKFGITFDILLRSIQFPHRMLQNLIKCLMMLTDRYEQQQKCTIYNRIADCSWNCESQFGNITHGCWLIPWQTKITIRLRWENKLAEIFSIRIRLNSHTHMGPDGKSSLRWNLCLWPSWRERKSEAQKRSSQWVQLP